MPSFKSIDFTDRSDDGRFPARTDRQAVIVTTHIPGADGDNIQLLGTTSGRLALQIECNAATLDSLFDEVGTSGTLSYGSQSSTAVLVGINGAAQHMGFDIFRATLEFVVS